MKDETIYLKDLLAHVKRISQFTTEGKDVFLKDEKTQFAVIRAYEVIGEIAKRLPQSLRDSNPSITTTNRFPRFFSAQL